MIVDTNGGRVEWRPGGANRGNNGPPPDDAALRKAMAENEGWAAIRAAYNAATGESRSLGSLKARAGRLRLRIPRRVKPGPCVQWDARALARVMARGLPCREAVAAYNAATGQHKTADALKARWKLQCERAAAGKAPKAGDAALPPVEDRRELALRIQRVGLYRDCFGIADRPLTPAEFEQALHGDPDDWPDSPARRPGDMDTAGVARRPRVYRMRLPRGVAS